MIRPNAREVFRFVMACVAIAALALLYGWAMRGAPFPVPPPPD
jgi:hypothetical protein